MMKTTITTLPDPHGLSPDPLTDILRAGARDLIQQTVEAEPYMSIEAHADGQTEGRRARLKRHGHLPGCEMLNEIGVVPGIYAGCLSGFAR